MAPSSLSLTVTPASFASKRQQQQQQRNCFTPRNLLISAVVSVVQIIFLVWATATATDSTNDIFLSQYNNRPEAILGFLQQQSSDKQKQEHQKQSDCSYDTLTASSFSLDWNTATCQDLSRHFHALNSQFLQFIMNDDKGNNTNNVTAITDVSPASWPLINYGWYAGQGFGRLVAHATAHAILSLATERPFALDLTDRDPYNTWRSFLYIGSYDWDLQRHSHYSRRMKQVTRDITAAILRLPGQGRGEWMEPVQQNLTHLHMMQKSDLFFHGQGAGESSFSAFRDIIQTWHASSRTISRNKALLSPNWGDAWFPKLDLSRQKFGTCPYQELFTQTQNALFQPTPLARLLHHEHKIKVMSTQEQRHDEPYGAIHLRFVILQIEKMAIPDSEIISMLTKCLRHTQNQTSLSIRNWWLIADKPQRAVSLVQTLQQQSEEEVFRIVYDDTMKQQASFASHSNDPASRGKLGHAQMQVSIMDWMVLHEAEVAVVTRGAYGETGARGNCKIPVPGQSFFGRQMDQSVCGVFNLFQKQKKETQ